MLGLTQEQVADRMGMSRTNYLKIEKNEEVSYTQESLALVAEALDRPMADLIMWNPKLNGTETVWSVWEKIPPDRQGQALDVLKTFRGLSVEPEQPPPPAPQPPPVAPSNRVTPRFKEQPELPTIGGRRAPHVYLQEWLDHRNMEPERLAQRLYVDVEMILGLLDGSEPYDQEILWHIAKALTTSLDSLYGLPPAAERKPAKKDGKKAAKGR